MSSPPMNNFSSYSKKPVRELNSITNHLLLTKTLNALSGNSNNNNSDSGLTNMNSAASIASFKENIPNDPTSIAQQKALNLRLAAALKPTERDNMTALLQFYQTLAQTNAANSNGQNQTLVENSIIANQAVNSTSTNNQTSAQKASSKKSPPMTFLCRFNQRNRLIEVPSSSEFYNQQHGISHENLRQLIVQEFHLQKAQLIIQLWNEQYQEYIDIESYKKLPTEGRIQVMIEKPLNLNGNPSCGTSKSPTAQTSHNNSHNLYSTTSSLLQNSLNDQHLIDEDLSSKSTYEEAVSTVSPMENTGHNIMYDLLPKPVDGIPIPRFPPHIAAFLSGNGDANQLNALVQALYQEIVKYELYPNADELRSIVTRLVDRHPNSLPVIGSVELLVRKLYYKFCNERKKYPVELKRRQPNKRKRIPNRDEENSGQIQSNQSLNEYDRLVQLWPSLSNNGNQLESRDNSVSEARSQNEQDNFQSLTHSPTDSSSNPSSPENQSTKLSQGNSFVKVEKISPLNLSTSMNHQNTFDH